MKNLETLLNVAFLTPLGNPASDSCQWGLPVLLWGDPGIGKSQRIKRMAALAKLQAAIIFPSGRLPEDFAGVPISDGKGGAHLVTLFAQIRDLIAFGEGVIYFDEVNTARASVQSALLGVILDRRTGDIVLPGKIRMVAAANDPTVSTDATPIRAPLANRFIHFDLAPPTGEEWGDYMLNVDQPTEESMISIFDGEKMITERWSETYSAACAQFAGFLRANRKALHNIPADGSPDRMRAYPTGRTWEWACRASAAVAALDLPPGQKAAIEVSLLQACVGVASVTMFVKWRHDADLPSPKDVLEKGFTPDLRLDRSYVVYTSLASYVCDMPKGAKRNEAAVKTWKLFERASEENLADLIYPSVKKLINADLASMSNKEVAQAARPVLQRYPAHLTDALKQIHGVA